jgi:hypothetical protein
VLLYKPSRRWVVKRWTMESEAVIDRTQKTITVAT